MSAINVDARQDRLIYLLDLLSVGRLEREYAEELRVLLMEELEEARQNNDQAHVRNLAYLIQNLDRYRLGEIDLMIHPEVRVSNIP